MKPETEHVHDLVAAYVLDAVTAAEAALVERHLPTCQACGALERELRQVGNLLPALAGEMEPPPALRARLMAVVTAEAQALPERADPAARARPLARRPGGRLSPLLAVAAVFAVLLAGAGAWRIAHERASRPETVYALQGTGAQPSITGVLRYVAGDDRGDLLLHGLRGLPAGRVYEVWMIRGNFAVVRGAGVFRPASDGSGRLTIAGQSVLTYNVIGLTVEHAPRSAVPHLPVLATGKIAG